MWRLLVCEILYIYVKQDGVNELIDAEGKWDEDLLREKIWPIDVNNILAIPLSQNGMEDFVAWKFNKNYFFSVRSAYHMEWESQAGNNLRRLDGSGAGSCKDIKHTLFTCQGAREIWRKMELLNLVGEACATDRAGSAVMDCLIMAKFINKPEKNLADLWEVFITTFWYIWWLRRQKVKGEKVQPVFSLVMNIHVLIANFTRAATPKYRNKEACWEKAREGFV